MLRILVSITSTNTNTNTNTNTSTNTNTTNVCEHRFAEHEHETGWAKPLDANGAGWSADSAE